MDKTEYDKAMSDAQGDADAMLGACVQRIKSLEELADWAETLLCNVTPMAHCTQTEWDATLKRWRDEKHGVSTPNVAVRRAVSASPPVAGCAFNFDAAITPHILRNWNRERIVRFAKHLLGDECQECPKHNVTHQADGVAE